MQKTGIAWGVAGMLWASIGWASGPVAFGPEWRTQAFSLFSSNTYRFEGDRVAVLSDGSVSLAYRRLPQSFWPVQRADWQWQVSEGVPPTDLARKGGDDRNLALYFVFLPADQAQRLAGANVRRVLRNEAARVLVYVWGGDHARGAVLDSPYLGPRGRTIVLRGAGVGAARETVDLSTDYQQAFGDDPGAAALVGLALSGDSDDTDSRIRAQISDLRLR